MEVKSQDDNQVGFGGDTRLAGDATMQPGQRTADFG
jgi:hypothetical protein